MSWDTIMTNDLTAPLNQVLHFDRGMLNLIAKLKLGRFSNWANRSCIHKKTVSVCEIFLFSSA